MGKCVYVCCMIYFVLSIQGSGGQLSGRADLAISATVGVVQHAELPPWHHQPQRTTSDHNEPLFGRGKFDTSIRRILNMIFG